MRSGMVISDGSFEFEVVHYEAGAYVGDDGAGVGEADALVPFDGAAVVFVDGEPEGGDI